MNKIIKNYIYTITYQLLNIVLPLITTPYISRVLGAEKIGVFSYTYSIVQYFTLISMLGIADHGNRSIAMVRSSQSQKTETFWNIYIIQFISSLVAVFIYILYLVHSTSKYKEIAILQIFYLAASLLDINWYFWGNEKFKLTVSRNIIIKLAAVLAIFLFVKNEKDLTVYVLINAGSILISNLLLWIFLLQDIKFITINRQKIIQNIKPVLILFIPLVARSVFVFMDKIMLGNMSSMEQVGFYENAEKLILAPTAILTSLGTVMLPRISLLNKSGESEQSSRLTQMSIQYVLFAGFAFTFGMAGIAPVLVPLFLGNEFTASIDLVALMSVTIILVGWTNVIRTQYLIPNGKDKPYMWSVVFGALINFVINYFSIPYLGAKGAVYGWIAAEVLITIYQTVAAYKGLPIKKYLADVIPYLVAGIVMFCGIRLITAKISKSVIWLFAEIFIGALIYFAVILFFFHNKIRGLLREKRAKGVRLHNENK